MSERISPEPEEPSLEEIISGLPTVTLRKIINISAALQPEAPPLETEQQPASYKKIPFEIPKPKALRTKFSVGVVG
ncbi:hypothetical protein HYZ78_04335 [Candidatus Microgenomates bacterium]|nr:hypothetical protein [Candidatus Microgenomates bacterium]